MDIIAMIRGICFDGLYYYGSLSGVCLEDFIFAVLCFYSNTFSSVIL